MSEEKISKSQWGKIRKRATVLQTAHLVGLNIIPLIVRTAEGKEIGADLEYDENKKREVVRIWDAHSWDFEKVKGEL